MLVILSIRQAAFSMSLLWKMLLVFGVVLVTGVLIMLLWVLLLGKKMKENPTLRIYTIASCMGNYGFMGVPIMEALLPENPEAVAYTAMASIALNIMAWSIGSAIIAQDIHYVNPKKIFLNPAFIAFLIAIPLFITGVTFPQQIETFIELLARMCTPLCMLIVGMRLATVPFKEVFGDVKQYAVIGIKQLLYPLVMFLILLPIPMDTAMKTALFILMCCPVASIVLNFAEVLGQGQKKSACLVLLGTILSIVTIPLMCLLIS